jgi:hypothetical protein
MNHFFEHPGLLFGLLWAFCLCVAVGVSALSILLSFWSKCKPYTYRVSRAVFWGIGPLLLLFFLGSIFDPPDDSEGWLIGGLFSVLPVLPALACFILSRRNLKTESKNGPGNEGATL